MSCRFLAEPARADGHPGSNANDGGKAAKDRGDGDLFGESSGTLKDLAKPRGLL
jgi:hypothetical protein